MPPIPKNTSNFIKSCKEIYKIALKLPKYPNIRLVFKIVSIKFLKKKKH